MNVVGYVLGLVLSLVLAVAGVAKLFRGAWSREGEIVDSFRKLRVPMPRAMGLVVPLVELGVAMALVVVPRAGGAMALVMLALFSVVLVRAIRGGAAVGCGCFGRPGSGPVRWADVWRNGLLAIMALVVLATASPPGS